MLQPRAFTTSLQPGYRQLLSQRSHHTPWWYDCSQPGQLDFVRAPWVPCRAAWLMVRGSLWTGGWCCLLDPEGRNVLHYLIANATLPPTRSSSMLGMWDVSSFCVCRYRLAPRIRYPDRWTDPARCQVDSALAQPARITRRAPDPGPRVSQLRLIGHFRPQAIFNSITISAATVHLSPPRSHHCCTQFLQAGLP